jgi:hypothetical protein
MSFSPRTVTASVLLTMTAAAGLAAAQPADPATTPPPDGSLPTAAPASPYNYPEGMPPTAPADKKPKEHQRGDFDAGGQVRLPNGPDEMGEYATFNWIAVDAKATYWLLKSVTITGNMPLAVKKPEDLFGGAVDPRLFGGWSATLDARMPKFNVPFAPNAQDTDLGLVLTGAYMREGAMLLSEKDFPLYIGDFKPGLDLGIRAKLKLSSLLDFSLVPVFVYQSGTEESLSAVQIPMSTIVKLGDVLKVSADLGIYTGDDFSFGPSDGGRLALGAAIDLKIGKIITHAGAGFASLLTDDMGPYPTIGDSLYIDLNVKYAK